MLENLNNAEAQLSKLRSVGLAGVSSVKPGCSTFEFLNIGKAISNPISEFVVTGAFAGHTPTLESFDRELPSTGELSLG